MRFYPRKAPRKKEDVIIDKIASGKCDDFTVSELRAAVAEVSDPEELQRISWAVLDIAMNSENYVAAGYALKSIMIFRPMAEDIENALDNRVLTLMDNKAAVASKPLMEAIAAYARERVAEDIDRSAIFIPALLLLLEECNGTTAAVSYEVLLSAATSRPEFFEHRGALLVKELGSINNATRIYTARIITRIATAHPEYVAEAEKTLLHISTFYPDAEVKSAAAEAYQTVTQKKAPAPTEQDAPALSRHDSTGGLAEIMRKKASARDKKPGTDSRIDNRLLSLAANFARKSNMRNGQAQPVGAAQGPEGTQVPDADNEAMDKIIDDFSEIAGVITGNQDEVPEVKPAEEHISIEEAELRDMVAKVKLDFSESAESLLDSLGMKHMHKDQQGEAQEAVRKVAEPVIAEAEPKIVTELRPAPEPAAAEAVQPAEADAAATEAAIVPLKIENPVIDHPEPMAPVVTVIEGVAAAAAAPEVQPAPEPVEKAKEEMPPAVVVATEPAIVPEPVEKAKEEMPPAVAVATEPAIVLEMQPEETVAQPPVEAVVEKAPEDIPAVTENVSDSASKVIRSPIIPDGVRISAVKFKTLDQNKKQQPASKVSIKPHIKPLNRTPRDISKMVQQRPQPTAQPNEAARAEVKAGLAQDGQTKQQPSAETATPELTACPTCGEKIVRDQQYCLKCGTDLKSLKIRCPRCSQINARETGTCVRCGAKLMKGPAVAKQPDIL